MRISPLPLLAPANRTCLMLLMIFWISATVSASDRPEYAVQNIEPGMLQDAGAVYRLYEMRLNIDDEQHATLRVTTAVTILKEEERDHGELTVFYDHFRRITDLDGALYDGQGREIRSLEKEDVGDYSAITSYSLYEDARVRTAQLYHNQYPYTVELTREIRYDGYLDWPPWYAQPTTHPIEESRLLVTAPGSMSFRSWTNNDSLPCVRTVDGSSITYVWQASMLPEIPDKLKDEDLEDLTTVVRIAPAHFSLDGFEGDLSTWKSFGEWYGKLSAGRDNLPATAVQQVDSVVRGLEDSRARARALYSYLQSRTRYVSTQLGIGGWQPFDAAYVHGHGYGDCKALSNYMISLLKSGGITAYPVLVNNGRYTRPLRSDFPSNQFNHMIVCVPLTPDTAWLECTSHSTAFGHIGEGNENRDGLMITDKGGVMVHIPGSSSRQNFQRRVARAVLTSFGAADVAVVTTSGGDQQDHVRGALAEATPIEKERWITDDIMIPNMKLVGYSTEGFETNGEAVSLSIRLSLPRYASESGERLFFNPNLMERRTSVPPERPDKRTPVRFAYPYFDTDSVVYRLPRNYRCEALPEPIVLTASFGSFASRSSCIGDSVVVYSRTMEINRTEIAPEQYPEYRDFFKAVVKADRGQVVLVHRE